MKIKCGEISDQPGSGNFWPHKIDWDSMTRKNYQLAEPQITSASPIPIPAKCHKIIFNPPIHFLSDMQLSISIYISMYFIKEETVSYTLSAFISYSMYFTQSAYEAFMLDVGVRWLVTLAPLSSPLWPADVFLCPANGFLDFTKYIYKRY